MLSETWMREYIDAVGLMLARMDVARSTLSNAALAAFDRAERKVRDATREGLNQMARGTLVMYDPESGAAWKTRAEEYAAQVAQLRHFQRGAHGLTGGEHLEQLLAAELVVDALTAALLLPEVPERPGPVVPPAPCEVDSEWDERTPPADQDQGEAKS